MKFLFAIAVAAASLLFGALLAPPLQQETPLGDVRFQIEPSLAGGGSLYVPVADWGVRFPLHRAPFLVRSELRSVDREGLLEAAAGNSAVLRFTESSIQEAVMHSLFRTLLWSALFAALIGLALVRFWPALGSFQIWTTSITFVLGLALIGISLLTHSSSALERPSFYARGAELEQILDVFARGGETGSYQNNFRRVLADVSSFLAERPLPRFDIEATLASDLHSNALAFPALRDLAKGKPLFFVGDFAIEGNDAEASLLAPEIARLGSRVIVTSGNHDSRVLMEALARSGAEVLGRRGVMQADGTWIDRDTWVQGLRVRAWDDPLEWQGEPGDPARSFSIEPSARDSVQRELWSWWKGLDQKPDILLLHQSALAQFLATKLEDYPRPLAILTGHDHQQWAAKEGNVRILDAGSVGAGGVFGLGSEAAEMAEIYFSGVSGSLEVADMIEVLPLSGQAGAERVVLDHICSLPCRYKPAPLR